MSIGFSDLQLRVKHCNKKRLAVCAAHDDAVIEAVHAAVKAHIVDATLVGDEAKIRSICKENGIDANEFTIINEPDPVASSLIAVKLVHDHECDIYMKGLIATKDFLKSVLNKEVGLRTGKTLSHVAVFEIPGIDHLVYLTDVAFLPYPTLEDKVQIVRYAVDVAHACGTEMPHVAPLAAVEVVNPKMQATVDADALRQMNENGEITGCVIDGPLSMDIALYEDAAKEKGAENRPCAGKSDILLFPDIHAGNLVYKTIVHMVPGVKSGGTLVGTSAPVILTSRSDTKDVKINSICLAAVQAEAMSK